jgi:hypothetical protein
LGSEFLPRIEILSEDNLVTTNLLRAPAYTWSAKYLRPVTLRRTRTWGITRDGQDCHHLLPTPQPWEMKQTKVTSSLDTSSTLLVTTLALAKNFCLYQESSTRVSATGMDDEPACL